MFFEEQIQIENSTIGLWDILKPHNYCLQIHSSVIYTAKKTVQSIGEVLKAMRVALENIENDSGVS